MFFLFKETTIDTFISSNSRCLFARYQIDEKFLTLDPTEWGENQEYKEAKALIDSIKVVNDVAERGVKLISDYNDLTVDEDQKQYLLQCVQLHRNLYPNCNKITLNKNM